MAKKIVEVRGPYFEEFEQDVKKVFSEERRQLQKLEAEQQEIELQIAQQQHRKQRVVNALNCIAPITVNQVIIPEKAVWF